MATNHVAIMRSSARMAHQQQQQQRESEFLEESSGIDKKANPASSKDHGNNTDFNELSGQISVISISSSEGDDLCPESIDKSIATKKQHDRVTRKPKVVQIKPMLASLAELKDVSQLDNCLDLDLQEAVVIDRLLNKWHDISSNLSNVMNHLNNCSDQVTNASICCLESLVNSVDVTCDRIDEQVKALHKLMAKCDELGTKISVANSFCDEIKTLKKSVDTLENLYKTRPQKPNLTLGS